MFIASENKTIGNWTDDGACVAVGSDMTCGPGIQKKKRDCVDGNLEKCQESDFRDEVPCNLKNCEKVYGNWTDNGTCNADGDKPSCGSGKLNQTRWCEDGTIDKCTDSEMFQVIGCRLRACPKLLGIWDTSGICQSDTTGKLCKLM